MLEENVYNMVELGATQATNLSVSHGFHFPHPSKMFFNSASTLQGTTSDAGVLS